MQAGCWREGGVEYHHPRPPHEMVCRWQCTLVKPWSERGHSHGMLVLGLESEVSAGSVSSQAVHTDLPPTPPCASLTPVPRSSLDGGPPPESICTGGSPAHTPRHSHHLPVQQRLERKSHQGPQIKFLVLSCYLVTNGCQTSSKKQKPDFRAFPSLPH